MKGLIKMETVVVSEKYEVAIPRSFIERFNIYAGQEIELIPYQNRIEFIPRRPIRSMRGFLKGIQTDVPREDDRE
jgi:bifunctional DNA-binding transcriptional regulator/antitoxin component of YhaV-PrlF toxin-antitoxin module